jgi:hypothetical protein
VTIHPATPRVFGSENAFAPGDPSPLLAFFRAEVPNDLRYRVHQAKLGNSSDRTVKHASSEDIPRLSLQKVLDDRPFRI